MDSDFTRSARRLGITSSIGVVSLGIAYLGCLAVGLATLPSPQEPIANPWFTALEILILAMMPFMVTLVVSIHAWSARESKVQSMTALVFMALLAVTTSAVHFAILTLSRQDAFQGMEWLFSFSWPSVVYALDILAWDFFFPLSVLFAVAVFNGGRLENWIRFSLGLSGVLALGGLAGVFLNDMQVRNIGILGYAVVFPVAAALIGILFWKARLPNGPYGACANSNGIP